MNGSCKCKNIEIHWQVVDLSLVPRACQCGYCKPKTLCYVSKSGTRVEATIHSRQHHHVVTHGTQTAEFHECSHCDTLVFVSSEIDGELYAVINADCLENKLGFAEPVKLSFEGENIEQRLERRKLNWCCPLVIV